MLQGTALSPVPCAAVSWPCQGVHSMSHQLCASSLSRWCLAGLLPSNPSLFCSAQQMLVGGEQGSLSLPPLSPSGKGERGKMPQGKDCCLALREDFLSKKEDASKAPCRVAVRCHLCSLGHLNSWWEVNWQMSQWPRAHFGEVSLVVCSCSVLGSSSVLPTASLALLVCECSPCWALTCPWIQLGVPRVPYACHGPVPDVQ